MMNLNRMSRRFFSAILGPFFLFILFSMLTASAGSVSADNDDRSCFLRYPGYGWIEMTGPSSVCRPHIEPPGYMNTWDGEPDSPTFINDEFTDYSVHYRDTYTEVSPFEADHGENCDNPDPAVSENPSHTITSQDQTFYNCRNHLMTGLNAPGYAIALITPQETFTFHDQSITIQVDASTFRQSGRDWWGFTLTPYQDNFVAPLVNFFPDLAGLPQYAVDVEMIREADICNFRIDESVDYVEQRIDKTYSDFDCFALPAGYSYPNGVAPSRTARQTFVLQLDPGGLLSIGITVLNRSGDEEIAWFHENVQLSVPTANESGPIPYLVQLSHHSYNPTKNCTGDRCPGSWHWDNFSISKSTEFFGAEGFPRVLQESGRFEFEQPAIEHSCLRFIGEDRSNTLELSFDGGATWAAVDPLKHPRGDANSRRYEPYWVPIPAGVFQVDFRGSETSIKEPAIWSTGLPNQC